MDLANPGPRGREEMQPAAVSAEQDVEMLEDILGSVWLYIKWPYVTRQLTREQKERFADAVDASSRRLNEGDPDEQGPVADRWWREDEQE